MNFKGKAIEPIISIKSSEDIKISGVSNRPVKCPECRRLTMVENKCNRCGYVNSRTRMMIL